MSITPDDQGLLELAVDLALRAGALLRERPVARLEVETKSTPTDVVTAMDRAAEALVVDGLRAARPEDGVLGEEGSDSAGTSGVRWVVDPIDGTVNYLYGIPQYAVSIAAEVGGETQVGVVYDPGKDELFTARRGAGAQLDGTPVHCSAVADLAQSLVATGFGYGADRRARQAGVLPALLPAVRDIRRFGAASLDLCAVACGRVDAYYERGLHPWDLAAGGLVAAEAGARLGGLHGRPPSYDLVIAAGPAVFDALHDLIAPFEPDRD